MSSASSANSSSSKAPLSLKADKAACQSSKRPRDGFIPSSGSFFIPENCYSEVWNDIKLHSEYIGYATCFHCHAWFKFTGPTSNLLNHLNICEAFIKVKKEKSEETQSPMKRLCQITLHQKTSQTPLCSQDDINKKLIETIVSANLPFSLVDNDCFRRFVYSLNAKYKLPHRTKMTELTDEYYENSKQKILEILKQAINVALTTDAATTVAKDSVQAVTCHFIDNEWCLKSIVLSVHLLDESHTGDHLQSVISGVITDWKLEDRVVAATSDAAKNIMKALRQMKQENVIENTVRCCCHTIHLAVCEALSLNEVELLITKVKTIVVTIRKSQILTDNLKKCQQLATEGLLEEEKENLPDDVEEVSNDLTIRKRSLKVMLDVITRWSSTFLMLQRLKELKPWIIKVMRTEEKHKKLLLSDQEWKQVTHLCELLEPIAEIVCLLEGDKYATISLLWPCIHSLIAFLKGENQNPIEWEERCDIVNKVRMQLLESLLVAGRFDNIPDLMKFATLLDPRHKSLSFVPLEQSDKLYRKFEAEAQLLFPNLLVGENQEGQHNKPFLSIFPKQKNIQGISQEIPIYKTIPDCLEHTDPLLWWKDHCSRFPVLAKLARRYLCIPASSAPSERVFSKMNIIVSKRRSQLEVERVERLLLLSMNSQYL